MIQIRKKENQKPEKEKKPRVYKANTHKRIVIALWVLLAVSFVFAVYKNFTAIQFKTPKAYKELNTVISKNLCLPERRKRYHNPFIKASDMKKNRQNIKGN